MPPDPPKPRQPSKPEIQGASVDKLVGRATDLVGATTRKQTFTGLGAMKPPALPLEHQKTQRAPSTTAQTVRATPATGIRVPEDETRATWQRSPSPLPAPSQRPDEARLVAKDREIDRLRRERDEARAMAPRDRQPSYRDADDDSVVRHRLETLERDRDKIEEALPRLEGKLTGLELGLAKVSEKVEQGNARTSTETIKIIMAGVVTVVTAVVGARVTAPTPEPNKTEIVKSSAEIETEACNRMADPRMKGECLAGVVRHLTEPRQR